MEDILISKFLFVYHFAYIYEHVAWILMGRGAEGMDQWSSEK